MELDLEGWMGFGQAGKGDVKRGRQGDLGKRVGIHAFHVPRKVPGLEEGQQEPGIRVWQLRRPTAQISRPENLL